MVDGPSGSFLGAWNQDERVVIHELPEAEWERKRLWPIQRKVCHNYVRALSQAEEEGYLLVLEDDLILREEFIPRLIATIEEMHKDGLTDFALSTFVPYDFDMRDHLLVHERYCVYDEAFYGTLGMVYPHKTAEELRDYIRKHGVEQPSWAPDILVGRFCAGRLYATPRPLIDHAGLKTTGLSGNVANSLAGGESSAAFARPYQLFGHRHSPQFPLPLKMCGWRG